MAYKFSETSKKHLSEAHIDLQILFHEVIKFIDCSVLVGYRNEVDQNLFFGTGKSEKRYPESKHNKIPSMAVDVAPYPINWDDLKRFYYFGGVVKGIAKMLLEKKYISHEIRWGGDWDGDNDLNDQNFNDLVHFELIS